jgi:hypothetical protein
VRLVHLSYRKQLPVNEVPKNNAQNTDSQYFADAKTNAAFLSIFAVEQKTQTPESKNNHEQKTNPISKN